MRANERPKGYELLERSLVIDAERGRVAGLELWREKDGKKLVAVSVANKEYLKEKFGMDTNKLGLKPNSLAGIEELERRLKEGELDSFVLVIYNKYGYCVPDATINKEKGKVEYSDFLYLGEKTNWENLI